SYLTANTQTEPPSGTSGNSPGRSPFNRPCIERESIPQPDCTAMYCLPSIWNDEGWPMMPDVVGYCQSSLPLAALKAGNMRSFVPPLNTSPPPVASIGPQFGDPA